MVTCERCHRKFSSYVALEQHYNSRHPYARKPTGLEDQVVSERESELHVRVRIGSGGSPKVKIIAFLLILIAAAGTIAYAPLSPREQASKKAVDVGSIAPDFALPNTLGATFRLSEYRDRSNVLLFFNEGLACPPCLQQMQSLDQLNGSSPI